MNPQAKSLPKNALVALFEKLRAKHIFGLLVSKSLQYIRYLQLYTDLCLLSVSCFLCAIFMVDHNFAFSNKYVSAVIFLNLLWAFITYTKETYKNILIHDAEIIIRSFLKVWCLFFICIVFLYIILSLNTFGIKKFYLLFVFSMLLYGILLLVGKLTFLSLRKMFAKFMKIRKNIIIIGSNPYSQQLKDYITKGYGNFNIVGNFDRSASYKNISGDSVLDSINVINSESHIDEIFCTTTSFDKKDMQKLLYAADRNMVRVKFLPDFYTLFNRPANISFLGKIPVVSIREEPLLRDRSIIIKRLFDIIFSSLVIIFVLSWLTPLMILLIKLESRGPAFFTQERSGKNNQTFRCYKFRSMRLNNQADEKQTTKKDARITRIGAFMRKTSIDELPQFFNVLFGKMSIVGPRPHMLLHTKKYGVEVDSYMVRHFAKPGITGWAQVTGFRGETRTLEAMEKRIECDVWYLENWTFLLDIKIIFLTVWNIFKGEENAF